MKFFFLFLGAALAQETGFPVFYIDLDKVPEERFEEPVKHFRNEIIQTFKEFLSVIPWDLQLFYEMNAWTWWIFQNEKFNEIYGMHEALDTEELTLAQMILVNTIYELESFCTSIVARMADGTIIHSRNEDFDFTSYLR